MKKEEKQKTASEQNGSKILQIGTGGKYGRSLQTIYKESY